MQTYSCLHAVFLMNKTKDQISCVLSHDLYWENKIYKRKRPIDTFSTGPKKLATALILKTCQFFISVPNGTSGCFWKRGIPIRTRTQSMSTLSFHVCTSISRIFRTFFSTRVVHICHLLVYFTIVSHICIRN